MANLYVRSTDGSEAYNGTTWALAKATIGGAAGIDSTTDRTIMVSDNHAETPSGATSWSWAGTKADPTVVRCVDDSAEPPTTTAATATVVCDSTLTLCASSNYVTYEGISFTAGSGGSTTLSLFGLGSAITGQLTLINCDLILASTGASSLINLTNGAGVVYLKDVNVKFAAAGQGVGGGAAGVIVWDGGQLMSGGTSPTTLVTSLASMATIRVTGLDLTNASAGIHLCNSTQNGLTVVFRDCKLPDSWSGSYHSGTPGRGSRFSFYNCDSSDSQNRLAIHTHYGVITNENTIKRTGGASDGTNSFSWKLVSNADSEWPGNYLDTDEIVVWNGTTAATVTVTIEMVTDNVTLQDDDIELQVTYLGTSGRPLATITSTGNTNTLAAGTNYTTSSETWTTTGLTTPVKQYMSATLSSPQPQEIGFIHAVVRLYRASTTVYVCPKLTIS